MTAIDLLGSACSPSVTPDKALAICCAMSRWPGRERKPAVASTIWSKAASDRLARPSPLTRMTPDWFVWIDFSQRLLHRLHDLSRPAPGQKGLYAATLAHGAPDGPVCSRPYQHGVKRQKRTLPNRR